MARIAERFDILDEMTRATLEGAVRGMIVVGPPGVGKSYGVIQQLEKAELFNKVRRVAPKYEVIKGAMTAIGLYATLYKHSDPNNVLVFDDCDSVLMDDLSLNILKAALDSGKKRRIYWNSDSSLLRKEDIPNSFDFKGAVIFITNLNFDNLKSKKLQDHLNALRSRCHYIDTAMHTLRDRFLRIRQIHSTGALFDHYHFQGDEGDQVVDFMGENIERLNEVSLRMATKIADLMKISPTRWQRLAETTCMKNAF
jgi:predicted AAA+ superfamily ATPase